MTRHRARIIAAFTLVALGAGTLAGPAAAAPSGDRLLAGLGSDLRVTRNTGTGHVGFLGGTAARPLATADALGRPATARQAASAFLDRYATLFGVSDAGRDLRLTQVSRVGGRTFVRYQQTYRGLPVVAGELNVQVGRTNDIISVNGEASPDLSLAIRPTIGPSQARALAIAATARQEKVKPASLRAGPATLVIYDAGLTGDPRALAGGRLAWRVDVRSSRRIVNEWVAIEATHGVVLAAFNQTDAVVPADATQRVCDANNVRATGGEGTSTDPLQCDASGEPTLVANPGASAVADVLGAYLGAEATYDFFAKHFGRNSLDNAGLPLISTARFCTETTALTCPYANAFWNGTQMYYGQDYAAADDVVGHELTHGFTTFTSGLLYWFQSGAINEALSDIFGEFVDQENGLGNDAVGVRWLEGEDLPSGALRNMKDPASSIQGASPDRMTSPNYRQDSGLTDRGGVHYNSAVASKAAYLMTDGATFNGQTVAGIGLDKTAAVWYRTGSQLLTSGSDYSDLAAALAQACKDLTGTTPKNKNGSPSASGPITAANCTQVGKAITATEMKKDSLVATVKHTKLCASGAPTTAPFKDPITSTASGWVVSGTPSVWFIGGWFTTSGDFALWAFDNQASGAGRIRSKAIKIPATGKTFLAFRNYFNLQTWTTPVEGGVVEYATSTSGPWKDLGPKFVFNGYNGTIQSGFGNPLQGRSAFVKMSYGLGLSKADLTFLKGKTIYLRFTLATNADTTASDGWVIDDIRVYKCV